MLEFDLTTTHLKIVLATRLNVGRRICCCWFTNFFIFFFVGWFLLLANITLERLSDCISLTNRQKKSKVEKNRNRKKQ
jgi:hypothetical protein